MTRRHFLVQTKFEGGVRIERFLNSWPKIRRFLKGPIS